MTNLYTVRHVKGCRSCNFDSKGLGLKKNSLNLATFEYFTTTPKRKWRGKETNILRMLKNICFQSLYLEWHVVIISFRDYMVFEL